MMLKTTDTLIFVDPVLHTLLARITCQLRQGETPVTIVMNTKFETVTLDWPGDCVQCCISGASIRVTYSRRDEQRYEFSTDEKACLAVVEQIRVFMAQEQQWTREMYGDTVDEYKEIY